MVEGRRIIDADGLILGRMASIVAKRLLRGERIEIVNAERAVISGRRLMVIEEWKDRLRLGGAGKGPIHYRRPNMILRRVIRGMLPYRSAHGREAFKRLRVHLGVPKELEGADRESIPEAHVSRLRGRYVTLGEVAEQMGWRR
jgi:large subunit ribosomal protein L13